jgi:hypothetical protein
MWQNAAFLNEILAVPIGCKGLEQHKHTHTHQSSNKTEKTAETYL